MKFNGKFTENKARNMHIQSAKRQNAIQIKWKNAGENLHLLYITITMFSIYSTENGFMYGNYNPNRKRKLNSKHGATLTNAIPVILWVRLIAIKM